MAERSITDNAAISNQASGDTPDDFEFVPGSNLETLHSLLSGPNSVSNGHSMLAESRNTNSSVTSVSGVFEVIQKEHKLLKDELTAQSTLLQEKLAIVEEREKRRTQEMASLRNELDVAKLAYSEKEIHQGELERQLKYFRECSEKVDVLAAKLLESEDLIKHQSAIIQQFHADGFVSVQPPMLTDQLLAKELSEKGELAKRLENCLLTTESELLKVGEENSELKETVSELRNLATALQSQAEMDKAEWQTYRDELEQQINSLVERLSVFDPDFVATQPQQTVVAQPLLRQAPPNESGNSRCPRCQFPVLSSDSHHPCSSIIDGID